MGMEALELDTLDLKILALLEKDPHLTHSEIARRVDRSQPAVGTRIHKLEEKGFLHQLFGVDTGKVPVSLAMIRCSSKDPSKMAMIARTCPFIIHYFKTSGQQNVCLLMAAPEIQKIDEVVDTLFRNKNGISNLELDLVTDLVKPGALPVSLNCILYDPGRAPQVCDCPYCDIGNELEKTSR